MFCTSCGAQNKADAAFCTSCGAPMRAAQVSSAEQPTEVMPVADGPQPAYPPPSQARRPERSGRRTAAIAVAVVLVVAVAGGAFSAWKVLGIGRTETASSTVSGGTAKAASASATSSAETTAGAQGSSAGTPSGSQPAAGASGPSLAPQASYSVLADHYRKLKETADAIDYRPTPTAYGAAEGCTGFVFEPGGFNLSIAVKDDAARAALPAKCQQWLDRIETDRDELVSANVDASYQGQKDALLKLYGYLDARMRAMLGAATMAVDNPQLELTKKSPKQTAWYKKLHPASGVNHDAFEAAYDGAEPRQL